MPAELSLPAAARVAFTRHARTTVPPEMAGMELVNLYLQGKLSLDQTNAQLLASGHHRVLTSIKQRVS